MSIPDVLAKIMEVKQGEISALRAGAPEAELKERALSTPAARGFLRKLKTDASAQDQGTLIAEIKKASPSKGVIREDFDPAWLAERYTAGGASCLSVLTDTGFFNGKLENLEQARKASPLPALRKDFILDRIQLYEARIAGADAVLLIAACLDPEKLFKLHDEAILLGLDVLVEIHSQKEWDDLLAVGPAPPFIGINNRDLHDFSVSLETTKELGPQVAEKGSFIVAESGIYTPEDVARLKGWGAGAVLVGESLMRQDDPGAAAKTLLGKA